MRQSGPPSGPHGSDDSVTLKDVAAVAGVSVSTVSRALNNIGRVSDDTRERIASAAQRLGFQHNALARSFATGRSLTVGILARDALSTFAMPVLIGASAALGEHDLAALTYNLDVGEAEYIEKLAKLRSRRVDGVLVVGEGQGYRLRSVTSMFSVPVVYAFGRSDDDRDAVFVPDGRGAGRLAAEHLLGLGRRRLVHITAADDLAADQRAEGFAAALAEAGVEPVVRRPLRGEWTQQWGYRAARGLLDDGVDVDGVFCGDDWIALGVQAAMREHGRRVPDDVAIVGFDNIGGLVDRPTRSLTTIDPRLSQLGATAASHLVDALHGGRLAVGQQFEPCTLIEGATTQPSFADDPGDGLARL